jgi:hypothetical protein
VASASVDFGFMVDLLRFKILLDSCPTPQWRLQIA